MIPLLPRRQVLGGMFGGAFGRRIVTVPFAVSIASCSKPRIVYADGTASLQRALERAAAGTTIILADGVYGVRGGFAIDVAGSDLAPIVIRAASRNRPVFTDQFAISGSHVRLWGLGFLGANAHIDVEGADHAIVACRFEGWGHGFSQTAAINLFGRTDRLEIGYCMLTRPAAFPPVTSAGEYPLRMGIRGRHEAHRAAYDLEVHHCHFVDFPAKPIGQGYHSGQADGIENAASGAMGLEVRHHFHHNLMEGMNSGDGGLIDLKACNGCVVEFNTFLDSATPDGRGTRLDLRNGPKAVVQHNLFENTGGIAVLGRGHVVRGNRLLGSGSIDLVAGDEAIETKTGRESAQDCLIACNDARVHVGRDFGNRFPVLDNEIRGDLARVTYGPEGSHADTSLIADSGCTASSAAFRLRPWQVGPTASPDWAEAADQS